MFATSWNTRSSRFSPHHLVRSRDDEAAAATRDAAARARRRARALRKHRDASKHHRRHYGGVILLVMFLLDTNVGSRMRRRSAASAPARRRRRHQPNAAAAGLGGAGDAVGARVSANAERFPRSGHDFAVAVHDVQVHGNHHRFFFVIFVLFFVITDRHRVHDHRVGATAGGVGARHELHGFRQARGEYFRLPKAASRQGAPSVRTETATDPFRLFVRDAHGGSGASRRGRASRSPPRVTGTRSTRARPAPGFRAASKPRAPPRRRRRAFVFLTR